MKTTLALLVGLIDGVAITYVVMRLKGNEDLRRKDKIIEREIDITDEAIKMAMHYAQRCGINLDEKTIEAELVKRYNIKQK